jgi:hypothetical protein
MALLHHATLIPSKIEILKAWMPSQSWFSSGDGSSLESVGAFRFDDPQGEVGVETHLVRGTDGRTYQVPLTYRASPLVDIGSSLITTLQHSVLGERWVYDGCSDPVYVETLAHAILAGGSQAELEYSTNEGLVKTEATTFVHGSGSSESQVSALDSSTYLTDGTTTVITAGDLELVVLRVIDAVYRGSFDQTLIGTWPGNDVETLLAGVRNL